ncbi:sigma-54 interaction domain-containing protein [Tepidibacter formicigenes]|jgi:transcriptional regulator with PAS, ATPase and Fis domain|uniref:PAS domain S-box-containing protein n=1 Tax=Tepidibacter formicigenes DSM 15518 TaxID=1123349 RepID=A0A1M6JSS7_9FIRM|nr:sigma 54-interacting transcriptional regulator [Tepidibacter formicigenes]SHJ49672.1 PAS domain S-box-containing protein [Tepidibacter formicigenes DSM 15518]
MKKLAIISYSSQTVNTYYEQIKSLFSENIIVEKFCIENKNIKEGIKADVVLVPSYNAFKMIKKYIEKKTEIVIANRTISKVALQKIMNIKEGKRALLLDESEEMALQMTSVIYQLGARHIELIPIYPGCKESIDEEILILLGGNKNIIGSPNKIIDIGNSLLDLSTIIDIGVKLDLVHILQRQNIEKSYKEIVTTNFGLADMIGKTNRFESQLDILLQILDDGIIAVNSNGNIYSYNESAKNIIGYKKDEVIGKNGIEILSKIPFDYVLKTLNPIKEKLIKINGYDVVVSVHPIVHSNKNYGAVAILKKFSDTEIKQHKLRAQLIGKGHIAKYRFEDILGKSDLIKKCKDIAKRMSNSDSSILISGESGTGKELFAQAIHNSSKRKDYQFVAINCGAFPESLLESELFGYEEGAFTGARKGGKPGLFELAHNGTLFLDEIGEMPLNLQKRLLRVLQEREVMRIGGDRLIKINIRVIAATNRDLKEMVKKGEFREDLYYRLNVLPLKIPPLRVRKEDILLLVNQMKNQFNCNFNLTEDAKELLLSHNWRGNVRELKNYIEYFSNLGLENVDVDDLPFWNEENLNYYILDSEEKKLLENFLEYIGKNIQKYLFVLEELENSYIDKKRLGRRSLYQLAKKKGIFISEQEIRIILINLEKFLMVEIFKGRSGTVITDYGRRVFKYLKG